MTSDQNFTVDRELGGRAKNLLDDLTELDRKIPQELERGVREGYLEQPKVDGLAAKLGVDAPRFRRPIWVYFEHRQIQSIQVDAYDSEDALRIFREQYESELRAGGVPYGTRRSRWADSDRAHAIASVPTTERPNLDHNLPFYVERRGDPRPLHPEPEPEVAEDAKVPAQREPNGGTPWFEGKDPF